MNNSNIKTNKRMNVKSAHRSLSLFKSVITKGKKKKKAKKEFHESNVSNFVLASKLIDHLNSS